MISRSAEGKIADALQDTPVVLIHGARQVGKSTLVKRLAERKLSARYVTLDEATMLAAARSDPQLFLQEIGTPVAIDEVQRAPGLFLAIKAAVDRNRIPGSYLLTGSANVLLLPKLSESLAGRMEIVELHPFTQGELEGRVESFVDRVFSDSMPRKVEPCDNMRLLRKRIVLGGYPEVLDHDRPERRAAWFESYISTVLQRDVRELANIEGLLDLPRLLQMLAVRSGQLMNFSALSRDLGIPGTTLKRYLALLETIFLVGRLRPWSGNIGKRLVKSSKIYLNDSGLTAHLLGVEDVEGQRAAEAAGRLLEVFVVAELSRQLVWSRTRPRMYHFRALKTGEEVDVVLEARDGRVVSVEIKSGIRVRKDDLQGTGALAAQVGDRFHRGVVLYGGDEVVPFGKNLHAVPLSALWQW
jgi:uncharacterized protein